MGITEPVDTVSIDAKLVASDKLVATELGYDESTVIEKVVLRPRETVREIDIRFVSSPSNLLSSPSFRWDSLEAGREKVFSNVHIFRFVHFNRDYLSALTEKTRCSIHVEVVKGGNVIATSNKVSIEVYPYRWWRRWGGPASFGSLLEPGDASVVSKRPVIATDLRKAGLEHPFQAYVRNGPDGIKAIAESAYRSVAAAKLSPRRTVTFEGGFENVRSPGMVEVTHQATEAESAAFYASVLLNLGLKTVAVVLKERILVGFWTEQGVFLPDTKDVNRLRKEADDGRIIFVHPSAMMSGSSFQDSCSSAKNILRDKIVSVTDIDASLQLRRKMLQRPFMLFNSQTDSDDDEATEESIIGSDVELRWESRLLDTTKRNPLVSIKPSTLRFPLLVPDIQRFLDAVMRKESFVLSKERPESLSVQEFQKDPLNVYRMVLGEGAQEQLVGDLSALFSNGILTMPYSRTETAKNLNALYDDAQDRIRDSDVNPVYLAINLIRWKDAKDTVNYAPFLLFKVELHTDNEEESDKDKGKRKRSPDTVFSITNPTDPCINPTFLQKMKKEFGVDFDGDQFNFDESTAIDLGHVTKVFTKALAAMPEQDAEIVPGVMLGSFSFSAYVLWDDLRRNRDLLRTNTLVDSLICGENKLNSERITDAEFFRDVHLTTDADGSQMIAINAALRGESFVLHGPPGTGKSQTITNIITNLLRQNKKVLFVAEKPTALNVVYDRLSGIGLGDFCLRIDAKASGNRHEIVRKLNRTAGLKAGEEVSDYQSKENYYNDLADSLRDYRDVLYSPSYFGMGFRTLVNEYFKMDRAISDDMPLDRGWPDKYRDKGEFLVSLNQLLNGLLEDIEGFDPNMFSLADSELTSMTSDDFDKILGIAKQFEGVMQSLMDDGLIGIAWIDGARRTEITDVMSRFTEDLDTQDINAYLLNPSLSGYLRKGEAVDDIQREDNDMSAFKEITDSIFAKYAPGYTEFSECIRSADQKLTEIKTVTATKPLSIIKIDMFDPHREDRLGYWAELSGSFDPREMPNIREYCAQSENLIFAMGVVKVDVQYLRDIGIREDFVINEANVKAVSSLALRSALGSGESLRGITETLGRTPLMLTNPLSDNDLAYADRFKDALESLRSFIITPDIVDTVHGKIKHILEAKIREKDLVQANAAFQGPEDEMFGRCDKEFRRLTNQGARKYFAFRKEMIAGSESASDSIRDIHVHSADVMRYRSELLSVGIPEAVVDGPSLSKLPQGILDSIGDFNSLCDAWSGLDSNLVRLKDLMNQMESSSWSRSVIEEMHIVTESMDKALKVLDDRDYNVEKLLHEIISDSDTLYKTIDKDSKWGGLWNDSIMTCSEMDFKDVGSRMSSIDNLPRRERNEGRSNFMAECPHVKDPHSKFSRVSAAYSDVWEARTTYRNMSLDVVFRYRDAVSMASDICRRHLSRYSVHLDFINSMDAATQEALQKEKGLVQRFSDSVSLLESDIGSMLKVPIEGWGTDLLLYVASNLEAMFDNMDTVRSSYDTLNSIREELRSYALTKDEFREFQRYLDTLDEADALFEQLGAYQSPGIMDAIVTGTIRLRMNELLSEIGGIKTIFSGIDEEYKKKQSLLQKDYSERKHVLYESAKIMDGELDEVKAVLSHLQEMGCLSASMFPRLRGMKSRIEGLHSLIDELYDKLKLTRPRVHNVETSKKLLSDCINGKDNIRNWVILKRYQSKFAAEGFSTVYDAVMKGESSGLFDRFKKSVYKRAIAQHIRDNEVLRDFTKGDLNLKIATFEEYDKELKVLNTRYIREKLIKGISDVAYADGVMYLSNLASNLDAAGKDIGSAYCPTLRVLFRTLGSVLTTLTPCMMMSPVAVAECLPMNKVPDFDYIIFDEASQIFTHMAVGAIARAHNAIIVGDRRQLPPSSFFEQKIDDDSADKLGPISKNSVLDECINLKMPDTYLTWHYRSTHESLIAFSNKEFYGNRMSTFPSTDDRVKKVRFVYVPEGYYESDNSSIKGNLKEARRLVYYLSDILDDPSIGDEKTIGIITFGEPQKVLIEKTIEDIGEEDPRLKGALDSGRVTIRTLETVQGEEYDIVLFSIAYGKYDRINTDGSRSFDIKLTFGMINTDGGWRRLNVAVTRSRDMMVVFSSVRYADLEPKLGGRSKDNSVVKLAHFLQYAESCTEGTEIQDESEARSGSDDCIALQIRDYLRNRGYECDLNVGKSDFRIDVAVVDPRNRDRYILGILTDGDSFRKTRNVRDRAFAQNNVLKRLGWKTLRVWTIEWYEQRKDVENKILRELRSLS